MCSQKPLPSKGPIEENELLLKSLMNAQEALERQLMLNNKTRFLCRVQEKQIRKLLELQPDFLSYEDLTISVRETEQSILLMDWRFHELYIGNRFFDDVSFNTHLAGETFGIVFKRISEDSDPHPLLRWPTSFRNKKEFSILTRENVKNEALSELSTSDWKLLQRIIDVMLSLTADPTALDLPANISRHNLMQGLKKFITMIRSWPSVLRYDEIKLSSIQEIPGYEALSISLADASLGKLHWPSIEYRLATADILPQEFGKNPRIEFPESMSSVLENWFIETSDDRGSRLELRFAHPQDMDVTVWNQISFTDQILIAGIIGSFHLQANDLKQCDKKPPRGWQAWLDVSLTLKQILLKYSTAKKPALI